MFDDEARDVGAIDGTSFSIFQYPSTEPRFSNYRHGTRNASNSLRVSQSYLIPERDFDVYLTIPTTSHEDPSHPVADSCSVDSQNEPFLPTSAFLLFVAFPEPSAR